LFYQSISPELFPVRQGTLTVTLK